MELIRLNRHHKIRCNHLQDTGKDKAVLARQWLKAACKLRTVPAALECIARSFLGFSTENSLEI